MDYIAMATGFILILIGLFGALTNRNILRMIVAFTVADTGVNLVIVGVGYMRGRTVIGVGVTALMLAYAYKLYEKKHTLDIAKFTELKW